MVAAVMSVEGYRLDAVLGSGGMSTVYSAYSPAGRHEAVKVLGEDLAGDVLARSRFEREAAVTAALDHPNIVKVVALGLTDPRPWLALEYVGPDAESVLQRGAVTPRRACRIVAGVAAALDELARVRVVHGDVKPANILLGDDGRVVLTDFGAAVDLGDADLAVGRDAPVASLAYAAPEVIRGEAVDARTDVYALGCTLFRLLTAGRYPFPVDGGRAELARAHCEDRPPRVSDVVVWASPALDDVIATAMAKSPADRFASAGLFAAAAERAMEAPAPAVVSSPPPLAGRLNSPARVRVRPRVRVSAPALSVGQRRIAAAVGVGAAVVAVPVLVWAGRTGDSGAPQGGAPSGSASSSVSSAASSASEAQAAAELARLRRLVPSGYPPGGCAPASPDSGVAAAVVCGANTDVAGSTSARYRLLSSLAGVRPALDAVMAGGATVLCPGATGPMLSPGAWRRLADPGVVAGTLWCGLRDGRPVVAWSTDDARLVSSIESADPAGLPALYAWWTQHS